ncbi:MAG TPA: hypothetical protein VIL78_00685 [Hanamia sp.]
MDFGDISTDTPVFVSGVPGSTAASDAALAAITNQYNAQVVAADAAASLAPLVTAPVSANPAGVSSGLLSGLLAFGRGLTPTGASVAKGSGGLKPGSAVPAAAGTIFGLPSTVVIIGGLLLVFVLMKKR